tara:strand:- start:35 stop:589 length:555 start_codon:yes stop_codon:yes gene_type:complete
MKLLIIIIVVFFIVGCAIENVEKEIVDEVANMKLTSSAFEHNGKIPSEYTCDWEDVSPELNIDEVPSNAKSLALIMDDPDVPKNLRPDGMWVHWVVWNIPVNTKTIPRATEPEGMGGNSNFGRAGYGGPCPPDREHRYFFKLYALDIELDLPEGSTKEELEKAMEGHIIEKTELIGLYERNKKE